MELFLGFFHLMGGVLLRVEEEGKLTGKVPKVMNATFFAITLKVDCMDGFDSFMPISIYNCIYKLISKFLVVRLNKLIFKCISSEQFGFLEGCQIHEAIGSTQKGLHSIKVNNLLLQ